MANLIFKSIYRCVLIGPLIFSACQLGSRTQLQHTWTNPETKAILFNKVFVVAFFPQESSRRAVEDGVARRLRANEAIPAYTLFQSEEVKSVDAVRPKLEAMGFDGALAIRYVDSGEKTSVYTPPSRRPFWDQYAVGWQSDAGTQVVQRKWVKVETSIYDIKSGNLLWSGLSETIEPSSVDKAIQEVAPILAKELQSKGLLPK